MRIPNNIIVKNKYTVGNEFVDPTTNLSYQGYYYELNGSFFQGKEFRTDAPKIIRKQEENTLLNDPSTAAFSRISGITSQQLQPLKIPSSPQSFNGNRGTRFFVKQINAYPTSIKEINEETFKLLNTKPSPFYQAIFVGEYNNQFLSISQANQQMSGLETFLLG